MNPRGRVQGDRNEPKGMGKCDNYDELLISKKKNFPEEAHYHAHACYDMCNTFESSSMRVRFWSLKSSSCRYSEVGVGEEMQ